MGFGNINLWTSDPEPDLQRFSSIRHYARTERLPWRKLSSGIKEELRARSPKTQNLNSHQEHTPFPLRKTSLLPRRLFQQILRERFQSSLADASINALKHKAPLESAAQLLSTRQKFIGALFTLILVIAIILAPIPILIVFNAIATAYFVCAIGFRLLLTVIATQADEKDMEPSEPLLDEELPVISILLPLFDEADALPILAAAIDKLDYPLEKLDIKLILELCDEKTIAQARHLGLDDRYELIVLPLSHPQTKPKACNHALYLARGDLVVIYDAEDQPERDQLRKAAAAFSNSDSRLACVQAKLNYYNADENWLTRLFALEYALWFDSFLPALEKLKAPIPLGGTSNIFRTDTLIEVGGWDPYNVTEDADLGLRLARHGFRTEIIDSTTFEEANCRTRNWLRQRSRWMKGYMQTWLVHMRKPTELFRVSGWSGFASTQLFIAGNVFSALINPLLWAVFFFWLITQSTSVAILFPGPLLWLNLFALLVGNFFFIYLGIVAPLKRGWAELAPSALLAPAYWSLTSIAAYMALWQLVTRPHYWEKTDHVLSASSRLKRDEALQNCALRQ